MSHEMRVFSIAMIGLVFYVTAQNNSQAESITLTEETAFNTTGGPFDSGLTVAATSNSSTGPGTITIDQYTYANVTSSTISQYVNGTFAYEPFNGIIIYSGSSDPVFTSVTVTGISASYNNPSYPGPFTSSDVTFNDHEIALNFEGISLIGSVSLSFTTASVVPEPSSFIMTGLSGTALWIVALLKRQRRSQK